LLIAISQHSSCGVVKKGVKRNICNAWSNFGEQYKEQLKELLLKKRFVYFARYADISEGSLSRSEISFDISAAEVDLRIKFKI
jgi:hypothetical protein